MLTIRDEQMEVFRQAARERLKERLIIALRRTYDPGGERIPYRQLDPVATNAIALGEELGCKTSGTFADLAGLIFEFGPEFYRVPCVAAVLNDKTLTPDRRIEVLFERLTPEEWGEVDLNIETDFGT